MAESASASEKNASSSAPEPGSSSTNPTTSQSRSCIICRTRKVRCDRRSPCSNCRRANIACVYPLPNRPPRWSRRFEAGASTAPVAENEDEDFERVMGRLQSLENLVHELRGQLREKHVAGTTTEGGVSQVQTQFGRLVLHDASRSRYVSSGFWAKVNDELGGLQDDLAETDEDDFEEQDTSSLTSTSQSYQRQLWDRHALVFRQSHGTIDLRVYYPPPSKRSDLLEVFKNNIQSMIQAVHMPAVLAMFEKETGDELRAADEALMFSIYYSAVATLDKDEVITRFGVTKANLLLQYRSGLEVALAKADCLSNPDINVIQALVLFITLSRGSESPRYLWTLAGILIRLAQSLGMHRDGMHLQRLSPYEIQTRRRVWWLIIMLDLATSEDQGVDLFISDDIFDTIIPLNLNDTDIGPDTTEMPKEREGLTDMSVARIFFGSSQVMRKMMAASQRDSATTLQEQSHMLNEFFQTYDTGFLRYKNPRDLAYRFSVNAARITMAKMTLIVFLPVLFSSPSEQFTNEIRDKLLIAAIEVAEYNHELHCEQGYNQWRWICQTYTHWHAIVFMLIEVLRRPWSCIVERAWIALQSPWLIPAGAVAGKSPRTWIPLQKLIAKARGHREAEFERLRGDAPGAAQLDVKDQKIPLPSSPGLVPMTFGADGNRARWRQLVSLPDDTSEMYSGDHMHEDQVAYSSSTGPSAVAAVSDVAASPSHAATTHTVDDLSLGFGSIPWLWADTDLSTDARAGAEGDSSDITMALGQNVDWHDWIVSATGLPEDEPEIG